MGKGKEGVGGSEGVGNKMKRQLAVSDLACLCVCVCSYIFAVYSTASGGLAMRSFFFS